MTFTNIILLLLKQQWQICLLSALTLVYNLLISPKKYFLNFPNGIVCKSFNIYSWHS